MERPDRAFRYLMESRIKVKGDVKSILEVLASLIKKLNKIDRKIQELEKERQRYVKYLRISEKKRKREKDTFLTKKDRTILIESFAIGGILEKVLTLSGSICLGARLFSLSTLLWAIIGKSYR